MAEQLLTVAQVATWLNVHPETVLRWVRSGKLPGSKLGREWRFQRADVEAFIERNRSAAARQ